MTVASQQQPRRASTAPAFLAIVGDTLEACECSHEEWAAIAITREAMAARRQVAKLLHGKRWSMPDIAAALGVEERTARRYLTIKPTPHAIAGAIKARRLHIVGPSMQPGNGERRDCVHESECLGALLKATRAAKISVDTAHCPKGCKYEEAPNADLRRYNASMAAERRPSP